MMEPSEKYIKYSEKALQNILILFVFISGIYFFSSITADPDLWGHILFGKKILSSKAIPNVDIYSYTAYGKAWINHEWLSEILMYLIFNVFGSPGLLIVKTLIGILTVTLLSIISFNRKTYSLSYGAVFVLSVFIMSPGFMVRPQLITFLCTALFLFVIHLYLEKKENVLWSLPLIMIIWVNSHGGFIIGAGILPVITALEYVRCHLKKKGKSHIRGLSIWMLATEVAMLVNPYGYNLLLFIYRTLSLPRSITEWGPVTLFDSTFIRFKIFSLCVILSFFINRHKNRYWEVGLIIVAMIFAFLYQRNTPILAILAAPFLAEKLSGIEDCLKMNKKTLSWFSNVILGVFLLFITGYQLNVTFKRYIKSEFNIIVDPNIYPVSAVRFLKQNNINGNILVPFDWGEYVIWKLFPNSRVSIDGRFRTVYPENVITDHFNGARTQEAWNTLLDKYPSDIVLAKRNPFSQGMITTPSNEWLYVYSDNISIIFLKKNENTKEVIKRFKAKKLVYPVDELSIYFP